YININIPIHKYTGIYTLVSAHKLIYLQGYLPGKKVVILGKNKWSLLLATRLIVEGADVKAIIDKSNKNDVNDREEKCIKDMNINVIVNSRVVELHGNGRIE
ncbi:NAD(P)/FAD-dependent oxidoreductase, partial [Clostridium sp. HCS.1]